MPPYNAPRKLYALSCRAVDTLISRACSAIWRKHGSFNASSSLTRGAVSKLQEYLVCSLPVTVLDDVFNMRKSEYAYISSCCFNGDLRILLALIMHKNMRVFKLSSLDVPKTLTSRIEDQFWITQLRRMSNLVVLDLSLVCTDEILEVVGNSCTLLEEVTVVSKMSRALEGRTFNALRKIYHVSDKGLQHLTKCQKLIQINLNASNRSGLGNITEKGICMLICSLPNLKYINYEYMGSVLAHLPSTSPPLKLYYLKDYRSNPANIIMYNQLCPSLLVLHIALPTNLSDSCRKTQSEAIEELLTKSPLKIQRLHQSFVYVNNEILAPLLATKGVELSCIRFGLGCSNFDINSLLIIGYYCPNLIELLIYTMGSESINFNFPKYDNELFSKLKYLVLSGKSDWNVEQALAVCLNAGNVSHICLYGAYTCLDDIFVKILNFRYLMSLESLILDVHCYISSSTVWKLLQNCKQLVKLHCLLHTELAFEDAESIQNYVQEKNYDIDLKFADVLHAWHPV